MIGFYNGTQPGQTPGMSGLSGLSGDGDNSVDLWGQTWGGWGIPDAGASAGGGAGSFWQSLAMLGARTGAQIAQDRYGALRAAPGQYIMMPGGAQSYSLPNQGGAFASGGGFSLGGTNLLLVVGVGIALMLFLGRDR